MFKGDGIGSPQELLPHTIFYCDPVVPHLVALALRSAVAYGDSEYSPQGCKEQITPSSRRIKNINNDGGGKVYSNSISLILWGTKRQAYKQLTTQHTRYTILYTQLM